ncbi:unnamed protein product [Hymenolepis diminuta]|uniref:Uncharacterized protein n=1 Tax=Hymenolepis diminuta TaxID=6216 RepID=A0A564ZCS7_HYMDI|nr:unnamed protein product [Hymenolepis diminuta]
MNSQTEVSCFHIDLSLVGPIRGTPYPTLIDSLSKWFEVISIKSDATGAVINSLR